MPRLTFILPNRARGRFMAAVAVVATLVLGLLLLPNTRASAATVTILDHRVTPAIPVAKDHAGVELGVRFTSMRAGTISEIQFYRTAAQKGSYLGSLWSTNGKKLASATFSASGIVGWQSAKLATALHVSAGETLVASYYAPSGGYAATYSAFSKAVSRNGFRIPAGGGVFHYGAASGFPTHSWRGSNYFIDVVFQPSVAVPSPPVTSSPTPVSSPSPTKQPTAPPTGSAGARYPTLATTGLPAGWTPVRQITGDVWIRTAGTVLQDVRVTNGTIYVDAKNVTLRHVEGVGVRVNNLVGSSCGTGLLVEDSAFLRGSLGTDATGDPVIGPGGYTARNVLIDGAPEGMRVGAKSACGPVTVQDSYVHIVPPDNCSGWHGDGIQGYDGAKLTVRNSAVEFDTGRCGGTAPLFYPDGQGNTSVDIDGLLVSGGGYSFRLGTPGSVSNLGVVDQSWSYGPTDVTSCSSLSKWQANIVTLDEHGQPVTVKPLTC